MARILIVDDEINVRLMIRLALEHAGHTVETASDGYEAIRKYGDGSGWDLLLLDQRMPGMSGLDVLRRVRQTNSGARAILITAFGTIDLAIESQSAGASDFLRKPFTADMLRLSVRAALESSTGHVPIEGPLPYSLSSINGFHFETGPSGPKLTGDGIECWFTVQGPDLGVSLCSVLIQPGVAEEIKGQVESELPGGDRFWEGLAGEALANYLWQNARPPDNRLDVNEMTSVLRKWVELRVSS